MKKTGIFFTVGGFIVLVFSVWDLFYKKNLPVPLTVTGLVLGVVFTFSGPAFAFFDQSLQKRKRVSVISLIISLLLIGFGVLGKYLHLPGANVEILLGGLIMSFFLRNAYI